MKIRTATEGAAGLPAEILCPVTGVAVGWRVARGASKRLPASFCWWPMLVFAAVEGGVVLPEARTK